MTGGRRMSKWPQELPALRDTSAPKFGWIFEKLPKGRESFPIKNFVADLYGNFVTNFRKNNEFLGGKFLEEFLDFRKKRNLARGGSKAVLGAEVSLKHQY